MLKLMSFVKILTCENLHTALIVHANVKFVVPILDVLVFVTKLLLNYFLETPICGKTLCAKKVNLCNGTNVNVCLVNVTNAVLMCYCYVPRKLRDLVIMRWLGGNFPFSKPC
jgi:hypothetical protein